MNVCSIIVLFNPDVDVLVRNIGILKTAGIDCIVVDNTPVSYISGLDDFCQCVVLNDNKGIASAQNIAIKIALEKDYHVALFLDQDTILNMDSIQLLIRTLVSESVHIAAPVFVDLNKNFYYKIVDVNIWGGREKIDPSKRKGVFLTSTAISSGLAVKMGIFSKVGLMDEGLFIDYVDTEWCLRCSKSGFYVNVNTESLMQHSIGDNSLSFLGFNIPVHSPLRRYYRVRNSIILLRKPAVPKLLAIREIVVSVLHQALLVITQSKKLDYCFFGVMGLIDGVKNKSGRYGD